MRSGSVARVLKLDGICLFFLSNPEICERLGNAVKKLLNHCQVDLKFVLLNWSGSGQKPSAVLDTPVPGDNLYLDWLRDYQGKWIDRLGDGRSLVKLEHYLVVSLPEEESPVFPDFKSRLAVLDQRIDSVVEVIDSLGMNLEQRVLSRGELRSLYCRQINPFVHEESASRVPPEYAGFSSLPEPRVYQKSRSAILDAEDVFFSQLSISELPESTFLGWMETFLNGDFPFSIVASFKAVSPASIRKRLEKQIHTENNNLVQAVLKSVKEGEEGTARMSLYLSTWAEDADILLNQVKKLKKSTENTGALVSCLSGRQLKAWRSCLVAPGDFLDEGFTVTATVAADSWTALADTSGDSRGIWLGEGKSFRNPLILDLFGTRQRNSLLVASCGDRSDWVLPLLTLRSVIPYKVVVVGGDNVFKSLSDVFGDSLSRHIKPVENGSINKINPCALKKNEREPGKEKVRFLVNLVDSIVGAKVFMNSSLTYTDMETSIKRAYSQAAKEGRDPIMAELLDYLPQLPPGNGLEAVRGAYSKFLGGDIGKFLDGQSNFHLDKNYTFIDLGEDNALTKLEELVVQAVVMEFAGQVRSSADSQKVVFVFPSSDQLLESGFGAEVLLEAMAESPGSNISWILGMEGDLDSFGAEDDTSLLESCGIVLITSGEKEFSCGHLTFAEREFLQEQSRSRSPSSLVRSAILCRGGFKSGVYLSVSPIEYCIVSQSPEVLARRESLLKQVDENQPRFCEVDRYRQAVYHHSFELAV